MYICYLIGYYNTTIISTTIILGGGKSRMVVIRHMYPITDPLFMLVNISITTI